MTSICKELVVRKKKGKGNGNVEIAASVENIQSVRNTVPLHAARR